MAGRCKRTRTGDGDYSVSLSVSIVIGLTGEYDVSLILRADLFSFYKKKLDGFCVLVPNIVVNTYIAECFKTRSASATGNIIDILELFSFTTRTSKAYS